MTASADPRASAGADPPLARESFSYHRSLTPMLWMFMALATLELFVVHLLVSIWSVTAALVLSALTLASLVWLVLLVRTLRRRPVVIDGDQLALCVGDLIAIDVEIANVAGVRGQFASEQLKAPGILNLALMSYPNVVVDLREPVPRGRRTYSRITHRLDDPRAFVAAMNRRLAEEAR